MKKAISITLILVIMMSMLAFTANAKAIPEGTYLLEKFQGPEFREKFQSERFKDGNGAEHTFVASDIPVNLINGEYVYDIEPWKATQIEAPYSPEEIGSVYENMSPAKRKAIDMTLAIGFPSERFEQYDGDDFQKYAATQLIIWEFVTGYRDPGSCRLRNTTMKDAFDLELPTHQTAKYVYLEIESNLIRANLYPSFTSPDKDSAPVHKMDFYDQTNCYAAILQDKNGVFETFNFLDGDGIRYTYTPGILVVESEKELKDKLIFGQIERDRMLPQYIKPVNHSGSYMVCGTALSLPDPYIVYARLTTQATPFVDVEEGKWYTDPVAWAVEKNITNGVDATHFQPNDKCTRGQIVTFLWRSAGQPEPKSSDNPFNDVNPSNYFYKAVLWAVGNGITKGTSPKTFEPDAGCTRAQIVTFIHRFMGSPKVNAENGFTDVSDSSYYAEAVKWAVLAGITNGKTKTQFAPDDTCTRAEAVTFLYRTNAFDNMEVILSADNLNPVTPTNNVNLIYHYSHKNLPVGNYLLEYELYDVSEDKSTGIKKTSVFAIKSPDGYGSFAFLVDGRQYEGKTLSVIFWMRNENGTVAEFTDVTNPAYQYVFATSVG